MQGLIILGYGGHARSVADVALAAGFTNLRFISPFARPNEEWNGFPISVDPLEDLPDGWQVFAASGDSVERTRALELATTHSWEIARVIAPSATVGKLSIIEPGVFVGHHAHVGPNARIGRGTILNSGSIVEHDARVGDFCHISVHTTIAGYASVGNETFVGAGATVIDKVSVGPKTMIGAGAVVISDLTIPGTYVGVPAKRLLTGG